ncbi:MAG TPA: dTDP-4-dehydrorhamnose 3,5-epimerase family protein [Cyclobacteriaceae bacterium]|nr:dTDP-4-dehydrorhamnose 3,5-epimerase family protein [Cyclobacteriaceae bacterium]
MDFREIKDVLVSFPGVIDTPKGEVMKIMKKSDPEFVNFGEAYFSVVRKGMIKGLKRHSRMTCNLVVPAGSVTFLLFDDRKGSGTFGFVQRVNLSRSQYKKLTIPPGVIYGFIGEEENNIILNIADIEHDPDESQNLPVDSGIFPGDLWKS